MPGSTPAPGVGEESGGSVALTGETLEQRLGGLLFVAVGGVGRELPQRRDHRELVVTEIDQPVSSLIVRLAREAIAQPISDLVSEDRADLVAGDEARL
jgi:hypothetical protein